MDEIKTMTMDQVEERLAAIDLEAEGADLEALSKEMDALEARKKEIIAAAEARKKELEEAAGEEIRTPILKEKEMEERTFKPDTAEYRVAWLKKMKGDTLDAEERTAMATVDVVPTITANKIINRLKENDLLKHLDVTEFEGAVNIPNYTSNGDASWGDTNEQQDAIGHVALSVYQLIKTVEVPGKFARVSIDAFEDYMVEALGNKIESAIQKAVIVGTGSGQPTGINVTHSTADGTFTKAGITLKDLTKIAGRLGAEYQKDAVWIMPNEVYFEALANVTLPGVASIGDDGTKRILGKPVVVDDNCVISSTDTIFYGAGKAYHFNFASPIEVDRDDSIGFKSAAVNFRGLAYGDGKLDNTAAFVKFTRATA